MRKLFFHSAFLWGCALILLLAVGLIGNAIVAGLWAEALAWTVIGGIAGTAILLRERFPILLGFLIALAALADTAGYAFTLWKADTLFDEAIHGFTSFAGMAAIGWALSRSETGRQWSRGALVAVIVGIGLALGLLWEGFEWVADMIGSPRDTLIDLAADTIGAALAGLLVVSVHAPAAAKEPASS